MSGRPLDSDLGAYTSSQEGLNPLDWSYAHVNLDPVASQTRPITTLASLLLQSVDGSKRMYESRDRPSMYYSGCAHVVPRNTTRISSASTLSSAPLPDAPWCTTVIQRHNPPFYDTHALPFT